MIEFQEWLAFLKLWQVGVSASMNCKGSEHFSSMDGAMTKAPLGGEKTGPNPMDRGQIRCQALLTEGHGAPIVSVVRQPHGHEVGTTTLENIIVARPAPTLEQPQGRLGQKGHDYQEVRDTLAEFGLSGPYPVAWPRRPKPSNASGLPACPALAGRTHTQLHEPLSVYFSPLGEETGDRHRVPGFCLCLPCSRVIRIGSASGA